MGFPVSTATCKGPAPPARDSPSLSQPRSSPRQGFSLTDSTRAGCRKDAWQQAQAYSLGGCLWSLFSSMSCNALRGPSQASSIPPCHCPSFPAKHHATAHSCNLSTVTQTPLPQGKLRDDMSLLSFWRARAKPRSRLERDRQTGQWARSKRSPARALAKGYSLFSAHGRERRWRILHCPPVAMAGGAGEPETSGSLGVPSPAARRAQETVMGSSERHSPRARPLRAATVTVIHLVTSVLPHSRAQSTTGVIFHGAIPQQSPWSPEGRQPEPTPRNSPRKGGDKSVLLFGHPHLLYVWGKPRAATCLDRSS